MLFYGFAVSKLLPVIGGLLLIHGFCTEMGFHCGANLSEAIFFTIQ